MSATRAVSSLLLLVSVGLAGCGGTASVSSATSTTPSTSASAPADGSAPAAGGSSSPAAGGSTGLTLIAGAPGTPAPATSDPAAPPTGGSGSNRFEMGAAQGLYVVDPAAGEPTVEGYVVVTWGNISSGNFIPPADATVTLNGVALLRDPNLNGAYWRVDPAGPQPQVGSGGTIVLVAAATVSGTQLQRTLVLPCPADIAVALSLGSAGLHLSSSTDITVNVGVPMMASIYPTATLFGYDPTTRALTPSGAPRIIPAGPVEVDVTATTTQAPAYLLDLRWPGPWIPDGQSGAFCGLAKRWALSR